MEVRPSMLEGPTKNSSGSKEVPSSGRLSFEGESLPDMLGMTEMNNCNGSLDDVKCEEC